MIVGGEVSVAFLVMPQTPSSSCGGKNRCCHPEVTLQGSRIVWSLSDPLSLWSELHSVGGMQMEFHKPRITFRPGEIKSTRNSDKIKDSFSKQLNHKLTLHEKPALESENGVWPQRFPSNKQCGNNRLPVCPGTLVITFVLAHVAWDSWCYPPDLFISVRVGPWLASKKLLVNPRNVCKTCQSKQSLILK